jgi:hypothetical protein
MVISQHKESHRKVAFLFLGVGRFPPGRAFRSIFFVFYFQIKYKKGCHFNP